MTVIINVVYNVNLSANRLYILNNPFKPLKAHHRIPHLMLTLKRNFIFSP